MKEENEPQKNDATNRAKRRKDGVGGLRQRIKRRRGVAIPRYLQPWAVETSENDEG